MALLEGYDLGAIGVAAPAMAGSLHIAPNQFGATGTERILRELAVRQPISRRHVFRSHWRGSEPGGLTAAIIANRTRVNAWTNRELLGLART